jgi:hypothetical protein
MKKFALAIVAVVALSAPMAFAASTCCGALAACCSSGADCCR